MPPSADSDGEPPPGQNLAVTAEVLYLANLLLTPGLAFAILLWLWLRKKDRAAPLARCHLRQTVSASIWAGVLLVIANLLIVALGGYRAASTWTVVILYFTCCHSALVLFGMLGLAKAMAGRPYIYPLVGVPCEA